jgi:protein-S-isoprenylcysteine O-methyltransferase Ste14
MLFWRALAAFLALQGIVAFAVPLALGITGRSAAPLQPLGLVALAGGTALLLWCVREFYVVGRGTLAPWAPPVRLVTSGPYRYSRNPMYLGVLLVLSGWATLFGSPALVIYAVIVVLAFQLRVLLAEEPWAARTFGRDWEAYRARVPRWLIRGDRASSPHQVAEPVRARDA